MRGALTEFRGEDDYELVPRAGTNELVVRSQLLISLLPAPGALSVCSVVPLYQVG